MMRRSYLRALHCVTRAFSLSKTEGTRTMALKQNELFRDACGAARAFVESLKPGDAFSGVRPEAERRFPENEFAQHIFTRVAQEQLRAINLVCEYRVVRVDIIQECNT